MKRKETRRGLAPLEFVLALPMMLFVMALILDMGTVGAWKVRAQVNGRYAAWRSAEARTGTDPEPYGWQAGSISSNGQAATLVSVIPVWTTLPTPPGEQLVRGPAVIASENAIVLQRQLEMSDGVREGTASLTRRVPLLQNMLDGGQYRLRGETGFLDDAWEYHRLGYGSNASRRASLWWRLDPEFHTDTSARDIAHAALVAAMRAMPDPENPGYYAIDPLDNDPNLLRLPRVRQPPDLHPRMQDIGQYDPFVIYDDPRFRNPDPDDRTALLSRIRRLPGTMASRFIGYYSSEISRLQDPDEPPGPYSIAQLKQWISQLNDFRDGLPKQYK